MKCNISQQVKLKLWKLHKGESADNATYGKK